MLGRSQAQAVPANPLARLKLAVGTAHGQALASGGFDFIGAFAEAGAALDGAAKPEAKAGAGHCANRAADCAKHQAAQGAHGLAGGAVGYGADDLIGKGHGGEGKAQVQAEGFERLHGGSNGCEGLCHEAVMNCANNIYDINQRFIVLVGVFDS